MRARSSNSSVESNRANSITETHRKDTGYLLHADYGSSSSSSSNLSFLCSGFCATSRRSRGDFGVGNCRLNLNLPLLLQRLIACIGFEVIWQLKPACVVRTQAGFSRLFDRRCTVCLKQTGVA